MVTMCTPAPGKLHDWKDFPKGMHVLVVISSQDDCDDIAKVLESCSYNVTAFTKAEDALAALRTPDAPFHAAMVEAARDGFDNSLILEAANSLPVIMISSTEDMGMMMKAISLGAADFLHKPFSEEKLRNIWQHVARKAMLSSGNDAKTKTEQAETMAESTDLLEMDFDDFELQLSRSHVGQSCGTELNSGELLQDVKLELEEPLDDINLGDGIVLDGDGSSEFSLDPSIFMSDSDSVLNFELLDTPETPEVSDIDREDAIMLAQVLKSEDKVPTPCNGGSGTSGSVTSSVTKDKGEEQTKPLRCLKVTKTPVTKKKLKVDWTPDLHQKFVQAVEQLGVDKAIPSRILELMGEKSLTRHNVASHLQKYRSHRKHLMMREAEAAANWNHRRPSDTSPAWSTKNRTSTQPRQTPILPILPAPPCGVPVLVWGHPAIDSWKRTPVIAPKAWQAPDGTLWQHPAAAFPPPWGHGPAPGTPVYPPMRGGAVPPACMVAGQQHQAAHSVGHAPREVVDAVISEALTNPYVLPLGLKPPSMESVLSELGRQGISITAPTPS